MPSGDDTDRQENPLSGADTSARGVMRRLGLEHPPEVIAEELRKSLALTSRGPMFERGGLCDGYPLEPMPDRYFVAQEFGANREDLREALTSSLAEFGVHPVCADDSMWPGHILCKASALIQSTPFGVYQLTTTQNRNVYLELGIAIGLGRPFVLVKDKGAEVSALAEGLDYYSISSYLALRHDLGRVVSPFLADIITYRPPQLPPAGSEPTAVIAHGDLEAVDFCLLMAEIVARHGLTPIILNDPNGEVSRQLRREKVPHRLVGATRARLDETIRDIQAARFGIYRIEKNAAPDAFLSLGISMGWSRPGFLVHRDGQDLPSDVQGMRGLRFTSYTGLRDSFPAAFGDLLHRYSQ